MGVKKALILAAGFGTRMGEVGETLPKILWPVFDRTLLELQVFRLGELGVDDIYMNVHHRASDIVSFVEDKNLDVRILHEEALLGSGGAFHNFKRRVGDDKILAVNGDVFYFHPDLDHWSDAGGTTLYGIESDGGYGEIVVEDGLLKDVRGEGEPPYTMFTGVSVVDLAAVAHVDGESGYFSTVADFARGRVRVHRQPGGTYYDFGTLDRYVSVLEGIVGGRRDPFVDFLVAHGALDWSRLDGRTLSYRSEKPGELDFGGGFRVSEGRVIPSRAVKFE